MQSTRSLGDALILRGRQNSLNFLRLVLASLVIVSHAIAQGGFGSQFILGNQGTGTVAVDGFFGISGYLICASALKHHDRSGRWDGLFRYLWDRFLRIFPAFWTCMVLTAVGFGVIGWLDTHRSLGGYWTHPDSPLGYVANNALLRMRQWELAGTPSDVPDPLVWNQPLWTLQYEFLCYMVIGALALTGLLRGRLLLAIFAALWFAFTLIFFTSASIPMEIEFAIRLTAIFLVGSLMYLYRDRIPDSAALAAVLATVAVAGLFTGRDADWSADWLTGPALVYPMLWLGAHLPARHLAAENDVSYGIYIYGYPVAQVLAIADVQRFGYPVFVVANLVCTFPLAAASWWLIEKRALQFRSGRFARRRSQQTAEPAVA